MVFFLPLFFIEKYISESPGELWIVCAHQPVSLARVVRGLLPREGFDISGQAQRLGPSPNGRVDHLWETHARLPQSKTANKEIRAKCSPTAGWPVELFAFHEPRPQPMHSTQGIIAFNHFEIAQQ